MRRNLPVLVILLIYLACILVADPRGEFPLNDDWSYTRSAFTFASGKGLKVDPWVAPSLIGQALYGGLITKIFSQSFLALRISTLVLSCCTLLLLWGSLLRTGLPRKLAGIILLAWAFNPLQFSLAFTFMTEIPFIFFIAFALYLYIVHLDTGSPVSLILSSAALGYAFLIRQTALLFVLALLCSILFEQGKSLGKRARHLMTAAGTAAVFIAIYYLWEHSNGGATAAVQRKFQLLDHLETKQIIGNAYGMLFYLSFMLLPLLVFLVPQVLRLLRNSRPTVRYGIPAAWCVIVAIGIYWFHSNYRPMDYLPAVSYHSRMPYLLNVLYDSGLGPVTLDPTYFKLPVTPTYPHVWWAVTVLVAAGALAAGTLCISSLARPRLISRVQNGRPLLVFACLSLLFLAVFEIVFSHLQEGGLFDRHVVILSFPLCFLIGLLSLGGGVPEVPSAEASAWRRGFAIAAGILVLAMGMFCVGATHDYMAWNRIRWDMGRKLLSQGVDPLTIMGGFEFNAWNNYDVFVARGKIAQTNHWWYDKSDYIISMAPQGGYSIQQSRNYFSWVHHKPVALYLLQKTGNIPLFSRR